jgi:hypothetical protein
MKVSEDLKDNTGKEAWNQTDATGMIALLVQRDDRDARCSLRSYLWS